MIGRSSAATSLSDIVGGLRWLLAAPRRRRIPPRLRFDANQKLTRSCGLDATTNRSRQVVALKARLYLRRLAVAITLLLTLMEHVAKRFRGANNRIQADMKVTPILVSHNQARGGNLCKDARATPLSSPGNSIRKRRKVSRLRSNVNPLEITVSQPTRHLVESSCHAISCAFCLLYAGFDQHAG